MCSHKCRNSTNLFIQMYIMISVHKSIIFTCSFIYLSLTSFVVYSWEYKKGSYRMQQLKNIPIEMSMQYITPLSLDLSKSPFIYWILQLVSYLKLRSIYFVILVCINLLHTFYRQLGHYELNWQAKGRRRAEGSWRGDEWDNSSVKKEVKHFWDEIQKKSTRHSAGRKCIVKHYDKSKLKTASDGKILNITADTSFDRIRTQFDTIDEYHP